MVKTGRGGRSNINLNRPISSSPSSTALPENLAGKTLPDDIITEILYRTPLPVPVMIVDNTQLRVEEDFLEFSKKVDLSKKVEFLDFSKKMVLVGSINGVVCVTHLGEMKRRFVGLWNPSINMWKPVRLLERRFMFDVMGRMSVGLGFDAVKGDFRIVRIVPVLLRPDFKLYSWSRVEIYSVDRDSWKNNGKKSVIPFWPKLPNCNFVVGGVPYWVGVDEYVEDMREFCPYRLEMLGRIDPCNELYKKVEYPEHVKNEYTRVHPVKFKESVAVLIQSPGEFVNRMVDMYVLDEKAALWTKIHTIGPLPFDGLRIPQCFDTGEIVIETWEGDLPADRVPFFYNNARELPLWYDSYSHIESLVPFFCVPETGEVLYNNAMDALLPLWHESYSHVESLVAVKGMELILKVDKKQKTKPRKKSWTVSLSKDFESVLHF
ncbi:uncharacterized protein LOC141682843 isoform X2 [Apium graveolens]|uniref:uncharacterized protein LOC141682843 isoform X2 n=1 Tax=Apium graveolens TaxID=4045 RepID=UPI003D7A4CC4